MFCSKCGKELFDEAVMCPYCGCPTGNDRAAEDRLNIWLCLLSVLIPLAGIILGIVFLYKGAKNAGKTYILCGVAAWLIKFLIILLLGAAAAV